MKAAALEDPEWKDDARLAILRLAKTEPEFTADDLRRVLRPAPVGNWVGTAFTSAKRAGLIEWVRYTKSDTKTRRGGSVSVWRRKPEGVEQ
ncbi:hypothetical protein PP637_gp52 [Arthrobacter phage Persistence]|uniref:Helix-turn-helix DNA-binding domain protein n=1 Tax=Arthrobacter phage Persistence TaxID=2836007 RepID=A0A8F3E639_9CAUD|nr:hypothetical protein PP637_gp52 [Arthrobacter phage Persistence]QWY79681.1 hypothetical protein SEA_PERSISTENCE_52 [Arthrobacter phage Persistence]